MINHIMVRCAAAIRVNIWLIAGRRAAATRSAPSKPTRSRMMGERRETAERQ